MLLRRITEQVKTQNWFAVALDFIIVVAGVGFAMYGQQWLSEREQRADLATAETALQGDLLQNYYNAKERLAKAQCRIDTYEAVAAQLLEPGEDWVGVARLNTDETFRQALPAVFRAPNRVWGSIVWEAELAKGTFTQMTDERRTNFGLLFKQSLHAEQLQDDIFTLQGRLKALAVATTMNQSNKLRYYEVLGEMDDKSALLELISGQIIEQIEEIGFDAQLIEMLLSTLETATISDFQTNFNENGQTIYGPCFLPTDFSALDGSVSEEQN